MMKTRGVVAKAKFGEKWKAARVEARLNKSSETATGHVTIEPIYKLGISLDSSNEEEQEEENHNLTL